MKFSNELKEAFEEEIWRKSGLTVSDSRELAEYLLEQCEKAVEETREAELA